MAQDMAVERNVRGYLERIEAREHQVGAWAWMDARQVLAQARSLDNNARRDAALRGATVGIKDVIATVDMPTEYGSPIYAGYRPPYDAACVAALRAAGAVIMGKTVTTEFAGSKPGKTANPRNLAHTPGGSSSGSAAAVADGMTRFAIGSQTGGSIVRPASYCGVVGYKPSFGLLNRHGLKPLAESLDTLGVFATRVLDAALLAGTIARRPDVAQPRTCPAPRIGVWKGADWSKASPETIDAVEGAARLFAAAGATVADAQIPPELNELNRLHHTIDLFESSQAFAFEAAHHRHLLSDRMLLRLEDGARVTGLDYDQAVQRARACRSRLRDVFALHDVLLAPSAPGEAPAGLDGTGSGIFNRGWTLLHLPCVNLPGYHGPAGLPVGVQLVGPFRADAALLAAALWSEAILSRRS
jgi:Asp-tRNA(Asn)/Glu-tRNA(Gln) amidotransferase A subunit family amidase